MKLIEWFSQLDSDTQILLPLAIGLLLICVIAEIKSWIVDKKSLFF